ncbi:hypothetical protein [Mycobacterium servetii]|uniref:Transposase n=1 Tax=Mycobacterium servetii TaxID=3237418 RepID=A0ABV4BU57_9MYCO
MNQQPRTRADQIRRAMGTAASRDYRITVTGTATRTGRPVRLRTFLWESTSGRWTLDTAYLNERFDSGDPTYANKVIGATLSRDHGRLALNREAWHLAEGVDVPIFLLAVILDAAREAKRRSIRVDDLKVVVSQLGSRIIKWTQLNREAQQHARAALYKEIVRRCARLE